MKRAELEEEIKKLIVSALDLEEVKPEDISSTESLFVEGLGLDSIDALELGMALKKKYQINFKSQDKDNKKYFASVNSLADFISSKGNIELED